MATFLADLRYGARLLLKSPGFALAAVLALALGIGANSAIFSVLDTVLIRPLPYADPDRLAMVWEDASAFGVSKNRVSPANFADFKNQNQVFVDTAAYTFSEKNLTRNGPPEEVTGLSSTTNLFPLLGVRPLLGRTFDATDETAGVVVLSYRLWQRRFGGDAALVGSAIVMNGEKQTVIGVMPRGFHFPSRETEYWLPMHMNPELAARRSSHFLNVVARLKPARDWRQAQSDMTTIARALERTYPRTNARLGATVTPLKEQVLGETRATLLVLLAAAACVLVICCANVANLLLARAAGRRREIAVRMALGAARGRLIRQVLTESLLLSSLGGILGLWIARLSMTALSKMIPDGLAGSVTLQLDSRMVAFTAAISVLTGLLFGLAPALQAAGASLNDTLKQSGRGTLSRRGRAFRDILVIAEVALALVLVIGAGLLIETLVNLRGIDAGFRPEGILTATITPPLPKYEDRTKREQFFNQVLDNVRAIPGVQSAGLTSDLPFTTRGNTMGFEVEGRTADIRMSQDALFRLVSSEYLETMGARLKEGRFPNRQDRDDSLPVVVINETFASHYWDHETPVGRRIDSGTGDGKRRWLTIVGVVRDIREPGFDLALKPAVYVPFNQTAITFFLPTEIAIRTKQNPMGIAKAIQQAAWSVDPEQPVSDIRTMDQIVDEELSNRQQVLNLLGAFAVLALVLAALGIYSVLAYVVSQQTREIGLRMAIGARSWDVVTSVLRYSMRLTGIGLAIGSAAAFAATRLLSALLYGVKAADPWTFVAVSMLLLFVALAASYLPARRAASVDPLVALREE